MKICESCGDICHPKSYNWEGMTLCLDCFLWYSNRYILYEPVAAIDESK